MRTSRRWLVAATCTAGLVLGLQPALAAPRPAEPGLSAKAMAQIEALAAAKAARTPADNKVESPLLTAAQLSRGRAPAAVRRIRPNVPTDAKGRVRVDLRATVTPALLRRVAAVGGQVRDADRAAGVVTADVPLNGVQQLADLPEVRHIGSMAAMSISSAVERQSAGTGAVVSEGDAAHGAAQARERLGVSGVGITVGVLSDGVDSLRQSVTSGELPPDVQVLPGAAGSGDEGTAMLQIVHDLAPKAKLAFATANGGPETFADNIRALRAAGADVLVDDILYYGESPFQDGPIAQAVLDVTRDGALYLSSAGNEGNVDAGTAGNYEGTFTPSGVSIGKFAGVAHDFDAGPAVQSVDPLSTASAGSATVLQWAEPLGAAKVDYDLYVLNQADEVVAFSNAVQDGDDDAFEGLFLPFSQTPLRLAVTRFTGPDRYFQLTSFAGRFRADGVLRAFATPGVTRGHSAVPAALSVAAVPAAAPFRFDLEDGDPPNPAGPFPGSYTAGQQPERFTSDGPRRVLFTPGGAPLTPGDLTATGGVVRAKPDLAAADGVGTSLLGFDPFFGTSAAAPHAAAIAALALSGRPGITPARLRAELSRTALDLGAQGRDRDTGAGVVQAGPLLDAVGAKAQPYAVAGEPVVTSSTDGDAFLEPGEGGTIGVPVSNAGDAGATSISVTVTSPTRGVTVLPAIQSYGSLAPGATRVHDYRVTVAGSVPVGSVVSLSVRVRFRGGLSPQDTQRTLRVGEPSPTVVTSRFPGPDLAIPDFDPAGSTVSLPVSGVGTASRVTFSVDGSDCKASPGLPHTFVGDLVGTLTGPDGTVVTLFDRSGSTGDDYCQTVFSDAAAQPISSATYSDAPFTGSWRPAEPLSAFIGGPGDGTWRFTVADLSPGDRGAIHDVAVHVSGYEAPPG